ncbi:DUF2851 family protein [Dysgonomonas macrotermitis]|uniref:DUF2851 domain-containing protein n=1 Tax=Dysgonomonas macrotermitis TaxID=1346286 RepID=A0A1M5C8K8_9BACT|nr:DUF2851 family protein [Dysgonomonas macrotermitis]SHF51078.1 Protein of unknown function [Dysgonomonas macrotermitis]
MEQILHYVWKHRLFQNDLTMTDGTPIEVLDVGLYNTDQGPDFFNVKIKVNDNVWAGNVEIHTSSEEWKHHKHDTDKGYNSVILHVVERATCEIRNEDGRIIPQCEIKYPKHIKENIDFLLSADVSVPCCNYLRDIPSLHINGWINSLMLERLERKSGDIIRLYERLESSWADVFYVILSRSMGFGLNSDAFERLALSLPLKYILKQGDNLLQIEALLFGQAGLLSESDKTDSYLERLKQEYDFLRNKYSLIPLSKEIFRNLRSRPTGSPVIRIAQLAALLQNIQGVCAKVLSSKDVGQIRLLFQVNASEYWQTHYFFGEESPRKNKYIGDASLDVMIINAVVPLVFSYGKRINDESYIDRAIGFLETIKPESNSIIKQFANYGLMSRNAYDTQALIQLKREYCEKRKCLYCRIGYRILSGK